MADNYPDSVVDDAFNLYLKGYTAERISRELKVNHPHITPSAIRKWIKKYDWQTKRTTLRQEKIQKIIDINLDQIDQIKANIQIMLKAGMNAMVDELGNPIVNPKSLEGLMIAIDKLQNTLLRIEENQKEKFNPNEFLRIVYETFMEVPEIKQVFENKAVRDRLVEIYSLYNHPKITLRKAAQLGLSTYSSLTSMYLGIRYGISTAYFFPTDYHMHDFVSSKFEPLINQTPIFRNLTKEAIVDNKGLKVFNGFSVYFRGLFSTLQVKSISVDHIIKDELNEADQENAKFAEDRMLHSKHRLIKELSQPSVENYGIDLEFKKSDQRYWGIKCHSCNTWNFPDETFPDCIMTRGSTIYLGCYKCSKKLNVKKGKWIAKFPNKSKYHD